MPLESRVQSRYRRYYYVYEQLLRTSYTPAPSAYRSYIDIALVSARTEIPPRRGEARRVGRAKYSMHAYALKHGRRWILRWITPTDHTLARAERDASAIPWHGTVTPSALLPVHTVIPYAVTVLHPSLRSRVPAMSIGGRGSAAERERERWTDGWGEGARESEWVGARDELSAKRGRCMLPTIASAEREEISEPWPHALPRARRCVAMPSSDPGRPPPPSASASARRSPAAQRCPPTPSSPRYRRRSRSAR